MKLAAVSNHLISQDCGLKTRGWKETEGTYHHPGLVFIHLQLTLSFSASLVNLVNAARWARQTYA